MSPAAPHYSIPIEPNHYLDGFLTESLSLQTGTCVMWLMLLKVASLKLHKWGMGGGHGGRLGKKAPTNVPGI